MSITTTAAAKLSQWLNEIPLYRNATTIRQVASVEALRAALPAITKHDIRKNFPHNFLREGQTMEGLVEQELIEVEYTAGTTDTRTPLLLERGWWMRQEAWALRLNSHVASVLDEHPEAHRITITSPICNGEITYTGIPSCARRTLGSTRFISLSRYPFLLNEADLDRMVAETLDWQPYFLDTDPVYATVFALHCERRGIKLPSLRFIITSYEYTSVTHRRILQRVFGVPVYNLYGSTETGHLLMENTEGLLVPSLPVAHLAILDADSRGIGELEVTTLSNDYMPLLRYRIGDLVEPVQNATTTAYRVHGRAPDAFTLASGKRITTRDVDQCFANISGITQYRLVETAPAAFTLQYIADLGGPSESTLANLRQSLMELTETSCLPTVQQIKLMLPENSGKFLLGYPWHG
ncbi:MAG: hypothetical protein SFY80_05170 [Verrucomicrobiota bacterium]|nr:hypothetical protein [Verrucomicrobiota bacterium]